ncbi:MAG: polysaccharide biosynthesis C-terminal domain-containing protein [Patescibacteria group bacterium]|nr:polysaccharide biosynthesis C-terminal domain-containing protein [Patescibacteria group bacterium]
MIETNSKTRLGFIFVLYQTPRNEIKRLKKEIEILADGYDFRCYFISNEEANLGFGNGVNRGIAKALDDDCQTIIIGNPDISLKNLNHQEILKGSRFFDIWGLAMRQGEKIYYGGQLDRWRLSGGLITQKPKKRFVEVDFVSGSFMIIKRSVIEKIGGFDEKYFLYYEDVDFCYRAKKAGFKIGIDSYLTYDHFEQSKETNPQKDWYLLRNRFIFFWKYSTLMQKLREVIRLPKTIFEELKKRIFYVNFFAQSLFSVLNRILAFAHFVFLINLFPPNEYGIYSLAWAHLSLFLPLIDFGSTNYGIIDLPKQTLLKFSHILSFRLFLSAIALLMSLISLMVFPYSATIKLAVLLISVVFFHTGLFGSLVIKLTNLNRAYLSSIMSFFFQLFLTASMILFGFLTGEIFSVFLAIFIGYLAFSAILVLCLSRVENNLRIDLLALDKFLSIAKSGYLYLLISLFARWYSRTDFFLLNFFNGEEAVGIYSSAYKFLEALMFLVTSYNLSSLPIFVSFFKNSKFDWLRLKIKKDFLFLAIVGFLISFGFYFFSDLLLRFIFQNDYLQAIPVIRVIIFALPLILLTSIFFNFFYTIGKAWLVLSLMVFQLFFNFILNWLLIPKYSYIASAYVSVIAEGINLLVCLFLYRKMMNKLTNQKQ